MKHLTNQILSTVFFKRIRAQSNMHFSIFLIYIYFLMACQNVIHRNIAIAEAHLN